MKNYKPKFWQIILTYAIVLLLMLIFYSTDSKAQSKEDYKILDLKTEIGEGKDQEVKILFEGERRKIAQLTLRNGKRLESHSVEEPIVIQCIAGSGEVLIQNDEAEKTIELLPGKILTIEGRVLHDVIARPEVSILLIRFLDSKNEPKN